MGIGDCVGHSNRSFLLPAMRADGVLIKPSEPALRLDRFYASTDPKARDQEIWSAPSRPLNSSSPYFTLLATNLVPGSSAVHVSELWPAQTSNASFYATRSFRERCTNGSKASSCLDIFDSAHPLIFNTGTLPSRQDPIRRFQLRSLSPVFGSNHPLAGWSLVGEEAKYVRVSSSRLVDDGTGMLSVMGRPGERVELTLITPAGMVLVIPVTIGRKGSSKVALGRHPR